MPSETRFLLIGQALPYSTDNCDLNCCRGLSHKTLMHVELNLGYYAQSILGKGNVEKPRANGNAQKGPWRYIYMQVKDKTFAS